MQDGPVKVYHLNATPEDLEGNAGIGRYVLLPGSDGRARQISEHFQDVRVLPHPRCHNLYLGTLMSPRGPIDIATVASGMGCPSLDIIVNELCLLGAKRVLRVGTAGSLQPHKIRAGHLVVATSSVRDEHTSRCYAPVEVPAVASREIVNAASEAVRVLGFEGQSHFGPVHCKDSLYAREFGEGPMIRENKEYMELLHACGIVASEMESSHLFILTTLLGHRLSLKGDGPAFRILSGTVLGVIGDDRPFATAEEERRATEDSMTLAFETIRQLAYTEVPALTRSATVVVPAQVPVARD